MVIVLVMTKAIIDISHGYAVIVVMVKSMNELTNRSHGDERPPETQWDWAKVIWRVHLNPLCIINEGGKDDDAEDEEEDEEHQLLCGHPAR